MNGYLQENDGQFSSLVSGKRIAVVGPAPYMGSSNLGDKIESYDLVVRFNRSFPVPENMTPHIGKRTDILYVVSKWLNYKDESYVQAARDAGIKCIYISYPDPSRCNKQKEWMKDFVYFRQPTAWEGSRFTAMLQAKPATGNMGIIDLLSYPIKEMFICGFTFYMDGLYYDGYANEAHQKIVMRAQEKRHKPQIQRKCMLRIFHSDNRIVLDETMRKIIHREI